MLTLVGHPPAPKGSAPPRPFCRCCSAPLPPWPELPLVGHQDYEEDGDLRLELRNCPACRATFSQALPRKGATS